MTTEIDEIRRIDFDEVLRNVPAENDRPPISRSANDQKVKRGMDFEQFVKNALDEDELNEVKTRARLVSSIVKRRSELGITQQQLAKMTGIKQSAIARLESQGSFPRIDTLCKIIKPLGLALQFTII